MHRDILVPILKNRCFPPMNNQLRWYAMEHILHSRYGHNNLVNYLFLHHSHIPRYLEVHNHLGIIYLVSFNNFLSLEHIEYFSNYSFAQKIVTHRRYLDSDSEHLYTSRFTIPNLFIHSYLVNTLKAYLHRV